MSPALDQQKREQIKQAARSLFIHFGFSKTAMDDIARECGLAKPSLYYYYSGKEAIFDEIVLEEAQLVVNDIENRIPAGLPATEKIAFFIRASYQVLKKHAREMADLPGYLSEHSPHGHPIVRRLNEILQEKYLHILAGSNQLEPSDSKKHSDLAATLVFMTDFLNLDWINSYPPKVCDTIIENTIEIIVNGLNRRNND